MTDPKVILLKLNQNLNILQQRKAKFAGNAPLELLNQISDHQQAIDLTRQAITGEITESEWREAMHPLNIDHTLIEGGFFQKILQALSLPTEQQRDLRNRQIMLQRVHDFWVKGVLEKSLHNEVLIELGMETRPKAVEYPWDMVIQRPDQSNRTLPPGTKIIDVFDESSGSLLILGEPGSGKTTMLLDLARQLITRAGDDPTQPIPVIFNLVSWPEKRQPIGNWLTEELNVKYNIPRKIANLWVESDTVVPLLDGLDEVPGECQEICVRALNEYSHESMIPGVVCSRTADYASLATQLRLQSAVLLQPLTPQRVDEYLAGISLNLGALQETLRHDPALRELVQLPLMLNMIIMSFQGISTPSPDSMEAHRRHLLETYSKQMFGRRGTRQPYTISQIAARLAWLSKRMLENAQAVFLIERMQPSWLQTRRLRRAYTLTSRLISGLIVGLLISGLIVGLTWLGPILALVIGSLFGPVVGLIVGLIDMLRFERSGKDIAAIEHGTFWQAVGNILIVGLVAGLVIAGLVAGLLIGLSRDGENFGLRPGLNVWLPLALTSGLLVALTVGPIFGLRGSWQGLSNDIRTVESLSWSWNKASNGCGYGLFIGSIFGLILGFFWSISVLTGGMFELMMESEEFGGQLSVFELNVVAILSVLISTLFMGLTIGLIVGLVGGTIGGVNSSILETRTMPNQGIRLSLRNAIFSGLIIGLSSGLIFALLVGLILGLPDGLKIGLSGGLILGVSAALWFGGLDFIQHFTLRFILWRTDQLPFRLVPFLNYCVDRIFLRRVGGGYIFIHRYLMEYFASLTPEDIERLSKDNTGGGQPV